MKTKSIMLIAVSLGFGLIAAIGMSQVLGQKTSDSAPQVEMVQVYVASKSLEIGDELKLDENLNVRKRPITDVPENAIQTAEELENMIAIQKVPKDVLIVRDFIMDKNLANLGKQPPVGYRAFTIKTELVDTHHNSIQAGDRIDIVGVFKFRGRNGKEVRAPSTFLKNIEVWQVNDKDYIGVDGEGNENISTITVLLTPKQVEIAILAQDVASVVRVVKTNREDGNAEPEEDPFDLDTLTGMFDDLRNQPTEDEQEQKRAAEEEARRKSQKLIDDLNKVAEKKPEPPKVEYKHRMTIYKGGQVIKYGFAANDEMPTVIARTVTDTDTDSQTNNQAPTAATPDGFVAPQPGANGSQPATGPTNPADSAGSNGFGESNQNYSQQ